MKKTASILVLIGCSNLAFAENLLDIYQQAKQADPKLLSAQFREKVGEAQEGQALGALLPQVSATGSISQNRFRVDRNGSDANHFKGERYNISLTQPLLDATKFWDYQKQKDVTQQYKYEGLSAGQVLILDVVDRYFNVLEESDNLNLVQQEEQARAKQLKQVQDQFKKSVVKITDVLDVEADLDAIRAYKIETETRYILAKESLFELTGQAVQELKPLKASIDYQPIEGKLEDWIEQAKNDNPIINSKEKSLDAAHDHAWAQKARHLPVVDLRLSYNITDTGFQGGQTPKSETGSVSLNMNLPIFSGGSTYQRANEATYNMEIARQEHIAALRSVIKETRDSYLSTHANIRKIESSLVALKSAEKSEEAMQKGFRFGIQTISDVLEAQTRVYKAKKDLLTAKYNYIKNKIRFRQAVGTLNDNILKEVNSLLED